MARDRETDEQLRADGWAVYRYWEHDGPSVIASKIISLVREAIETTAEPVSA
jgi:DNA mismatch endonuclease (patch repair protein)